MRQLPRPALGSTWAATYKIVVGADPAANTECLLTVPAATYWEVFAVKCVLVQGITQTPQPILTIDDGTNTFFECYGATGAQGASTTAMYSWTVGGLPAALVGTTPNIKAVSTLPANLFLAPGYRINTVTLGIGANTDYGIPRVYVAEYVQVALI